MLIMSALPRAISKLAVNNVAIINTMFCRNKKVTPKFIWNFKRTDSQGCLVIRTKQEVPCFFKIII